MSEVLVESIVTGQGGLDGNEVGARVALVGQEEQPRIESPQVVAAIDEVVSATKQPCTAVRRRMRKSDVR